MLDEELNRFVTERFPPPETVRNTARPSMLYKPITDVLKDRGIMKSFGQIFFFKACSGETRIYTTHRCYPKGQYKNKTHSCTHTHTHRATNKRCTKWNSSEKQFVSAGLQHLIAISLKWRQHFVQCSARVRTHAKAFHQGSLSEVWNRGVNFTSKRTAVE